MKTRILILTFLVIQGEIYAGESTTTRKRCFLPPIQWKYIAKTVVGQSSSNDICNERKTSCTVDITANCLITLLPPFVPSSTNIFNSFAKNGPSGASSGFVILNSSLFFQMGFTHGYTKAELESFSNFNTTDEEPVQIENTVNTSAKISTTETIFNEFENQIHIKFGETYLTVPKNLSTPNNLVLARITIYDESNGDWETNPIVLSESKAYIINGELVTDGIFNNQSFTNESSATSFSYKLISNNMVINIPNNFDINKVAVVLNTESGNLNLGIPSSFRLNMSSQNQKKLDDLALNNVLNINYDNGQVKVTVINKNLTQIKGKLILYNINGSIIENIANITVDAKSNYSMDLNNKLNSGQYIVVFEDEKFKRYSQLITLK